MTTTTTTTTEPKTMTLKEFIEANKSDPVSLLRAKIKVAKPELGPKAISDAIKASGIATRRSDAFLDDYYDFLAEGAGTLTTDDVEGYLLGDTERGFKATSQNVKNHIKKHLKTADTVARAVEKALEFERAKMAIVKPKPKK